MRKSLITILFATILAFGCKDNSPSATNATIDINGTWAISCISGRSETYTFNNGYQYVTVNQFQDPECATTVTNTLESSGTYVFGNRFVTSDGLTAYEIDLIWDNPQFGGTVKQLVYRNGDLLYVGVFIDNNTRPIQINFDAPLVLQ